jgi:ParB-like chromosome segregation protein Spo0J
MKNISKVKTESIKPNPSNPRTIDPERLSKLVASLKEFPEMLETRPIVVNSDRIILGGNMRHRAAIEAGIKEIPVIITESWSAEQEREFIIKDNVGYGDWDWDLIQADWDEDELKEWGVTVPNIKGDTDLDGLFDEPDDDEPDDDKKFSIVLEYTEEDYNKVNEAFDSMTGSKESIVAKLLGV